MRIAFITRSTLYKVHGGDTIQILETAEELRNLGIKVSIFLSHEKINYEDFDLLHFFNLIRPANILSHIKKTNKPFVISPILVDYTEYDREHRKGFSGRLFRLFPSAEYIKTVGRWILMKDSLPSKTYLWRGQKRSVQYILEKAKMILPNSLAEYHALENLYGIKKSFAVVPNGINENIFNDGHPVSKDESLVICAARIEGIKNQINLIKALNNTQFKLLLIGSSTTNQRAYYDECKKIAAKNIVFTGRLTQKELSDYYKKAKVHILPSWFETCGLSSLEAAAMGCNIVITEKGFTRDYFGDDAFYCDPGNEASIYNAIVLAAKADTSYKLRDKIFQGFTWSLAAQKTLQAYNEVLSPAQKPCYH
jgi:glycosyltransferase involved in cell wall biosynthesis